MPLRLLLVLALVVPAGCITSLISERTNIPEMRNQAVPDVPPLRHLKLGPVMLPDVLEMAEGLQEAMQAHEKHIVVDIDSPGGSVTTGIALLSMMQDARKQGMTITCHVDGMAASMAAIIFEAGCDERYMTDASSLLFHEPAISEIGGKEGDLRRYADKLADVNKRMAILVAPHLRMSVEDYLTWIKDRDRWVSAPEARQMGAAD